MKTMVNKGFRISAIYCLFLSAMLWGTASHSAPKKPRAFKAGNKVVLPSARDILTADEVKAVDFWLQMDKVKTPAAFVTLSDGSSEFKVRSDGAVLTFDIVTPHGKKATFKTNTKLSAGAHHIAININAATVDLWIDGVAHPTVFGAGFSALSNNVPVTMIIGSTDFVGTIGAFRLWSFDLDTADVQASQAAPDVFVPDGVDISALVLGENLSGQFVRPTAAVTGLWHQSGSAQGNTLGPKIIHDIVDPTHHGQFLDDEVFYSLSKGDQGTFDLVDSRGFKRTFIPVSGKHDTFSVQDESSHKTAEISFRPGGKEMTVNSTTDDFLLLGKRYKQLVLPNDTNAPQTFGAAWIGLAKPAGFLFSERGCFDTRRMGLSNFSVTGCKRGFFREPPPNTHRYSDGGGNLVIPWGWKYALIPQTEGGSYSTLATSSNDVGKSISGGAGFSFDLLGADISHNKNTEKENKSMTSNEVSRTYQNFTDRRHSLVVDAKLMRLDQCFIKDLMRAAYGLTGEVPDGPRGFNPADNDGGSCDQSLDDTLPPSKLLERYGNHYAYAVTYGARMMGWAEMTASAMESLSSSNVNVSDGIGFKLNGSLNFPNRVGSAGMNAQGKANQSQGQKDWNTAQSKVSLDTNNYVCFGGGSCSSTGANGADDPVPVYLDLRPMFELLSPPYFLDPAITVTLRRKVKEAFEAVEDQTRPNFPMIQILDIEVTGLSCNVNSIGTPTKPLSVMTDAGLGPFAPGGRFASVKFNIEETGNHIKSLANAKAAIPELCKRHAFGRAMIQAVGSNSGEVINIGKTFDLNAIKGTGQKMTVMTPFLPKFVDASGRSTYRFYFRLREKTDALKQNCTAPCPFYVASPNGDMNASINNNKDWLDDTGFVTFPLFPQFELQDPTTFDADGKTVSVVVGGGVTNYKDSNFNLLPFEFQMNLDLKITARNLQKSLGFSSGKNGRLATCKGRAPDFTKLTGIGGDDKHALFFVSDGTYFAYNKKARCFDAGPVALSDHPDLSIYGSHVAAMLDWTAVNGKLYLFLKDGRYLRLDAQTLKVDAGPGSTAGGWNGLGNNADKIVGVSNDLKNDKTYFFLEGGSYLRFDNANNKVDLGPGSTAGGWSGLTAPDDIVAVADLGAVDDALYMFYSDGSFDKFSLGHNKVIHSATAASMWK